MKFENETEAQLWREVYLAVLKSGGTILGESGRELHFVEIADGAVLDYRERARDMPAVVALHVG